MAERMSDVNHAATTWDERRRDLVSRIRFLTEAFGEAPTLEHLEAAFGVTRTSLYNWAGYRSGENLPTQVMEECYREAGVEPPQRNPRGHGRS